jgi:hypothetical protein
MNSTAASDSFEEIATIRIELRRIDPLIWRQVEVPTSITIRVLHDIIQAAMGWFDYHLWEFTVGKQRYGLPMDDDWGTEPRIAAGKVRLRDVLKPRKTVIDYTYDFGDGWEHRLTVTDVRAGQRDVSYPRYIGGERNTDRPRIAAASQASMNCSKRSLTVLIRAMPISKKLAGDYDPDTFDALPIKYALGRIANRRNAAKARSAKKKDAGAAA